MKSCCISKAVELKELFISGNVPRKTSAKIPTNSKTRKEKLNQGIGTMQAFRNSFLIDFCSTIVSL